MRGYTPTPKIGHIGDDLISQSIICYSILKSVIGYATPSIEFDELATLAITDSTSSI